MIPDKLVMLLVDGSTPMCIWATVTGLTELLKAKRYGVGRRCGETLEEINGGVEGEHDIKKYIVLTH